MKKKLNEEHLLLMVNKQIAMSSVPTKKLCLDKDYLIIMVL